MMMMDEGWDEYCEQCGKQIYSEDMKCCPNCKTNQYIYKRDRKIEHILSYGFVEKHVYKKQNWFQSLFNMKQVIESTYYKYGVMTITIESPSSKKISDSCTILYPNYNFYLNYKDKKTIINFYSKDNRWMHENLDKLVQPHLRESKLSKLIEEISD